MQTPYPLTPNVDDSTELSRDAIFSMLSNQRRRYVIHYLKQHPERVTIRDLSQQIAAWENGVSVEALTYKQRKRVYTSLHQTHLPKLDDSGVVDYDRDRGIVSLNDRSRELEMYLEVVRSDDVPWSTYYFGLSVIAGAVVLLAWVGLPPFAAVPGLAYATLFAVVLSLSALVHVHYTRRMRLGDGDTPAEAQSVLDAIAAPAPDAIGTPSPDSIAASASDDDD